MTNRQAANPHDTDRPDMPDGRDANLPPHPALWPDTARVDAAGRLSLSGLELAALAREYGTPLYVYDEATIRGQCRAARETFAARRPDDPGSAVAYAGKAYLSLALCQVLLEEGLELDVASAGELGMALAAGYPPARVHLHGNFKPDAELAYALDVGVGRVVVDSLDELARLAALAGERERERRMAIWLRLNPDVATETHVYTQTGHADTKFGLDRGAIHEAARHAAASPWLDLVGLHAHAGSQLFDLAPVAATVRTLGELAAELRETHGIRIREISPGGGLAVAYTPEQQAPAVETYAEVVTGALGDVVGRLRLDPPRLVVEPGRAIVARAWVALYTVGPRKQTLGGVFVAVDGGLGDNPRPALYGARYVAMLAERATQPAEETVRVVGRYCESGDVLVEAAALPRAKVGEILAIPVSGAYHLPMASTYNLVSRPAVVFVRAGAARLVRRRETLGDLLRLETPLS